MSDMVPEVLNAALDSLFTPKEPGEQEYQGVDGLLYCRNCHTPVQCRVKLWGRDKIVPCLCRCQQEAMAEKKRQDELVERQRSCISRFQIKHRNRSRNATGSKRIFSTSFNKKHTIFMDFTPSFFFSSSFYCTRLPNTTMSIGRPAKICNGTDSFICAMCCKNSARLRRHRIPESLFKISFCISQSSSSRFCKSRISSA